MVISIDELLSFLGYIVGVVLLIAMLFKRRDLHRDKDD